MLKISIVTISFNQARFLKESLHSVINQDYPYLEYIVVDPGSTDGSREIIRSVQDRVTTLVLEPDNGPADGLNKGFARATGDLYGFLNADDVLEAGALQRVANFFERHPQIDVMSGHSWVIDEVGRRRRRFFSDRYSLAMAAHGSCVLSQASTFFHAEIYKRCGGFNVANQSTWDAELFDDMALAGASFGIIPEFLSRFRVYDESISGSGRGRRDATLYNSEGRKRVFREVFGREPGFAYPLSCLAARYIRKVLYPRDTVERILRGPIAK